MARGSSPTRQPLDVSKGSASDRLEERPDLGAMRWGFVLTWFMRLLAILWILKGLSSWAVILGIWSPVGAFETRTMGYQATVIYFAVIDLVAAVGLWMASTWGGVLWLLAVMSHVILAVFFPRIVSAGLLTMIFFMGLIASYLVVSWMAAREE
ncbi:MAG TPA: DUF6163 family protein [Microvirga sp.]|jgi:hypothetical protein|nr:DUF6163 family protein [Microvirga sp.]